MLNRNLSNLSWLNPMRTSLPKLKVLPMLLSMLISLSVSAEEPTVLPKLNFNCLSRSEKEYIDISLQENEACHALMMKATEPPPNIETWKEAALYVGAGLLAGFLLTKLTR